MALTDSAELLERVCDLRPAKDGNLQSLVYDLNNCIKRLSKENSFLNEKLEKQKLGKIIHPEQRNSLYWE